MSSSYSDTQSVDPREADRTRRDVLLDGLRNAIYNRLNAYLVVAAIVFFSIGFGTDLSLGPYSEGSEAMHTMAGIFGVFGILISGVCVLVVTANVLFTITRTMRSDF